MALEQYKNIPDPTAPGTAWAALNGAIDASQTTIVVTSATNFPSTAPFRFRIDLEYMLCTAGAGTTSWTVTRGVDSSTGASHVTNASIFHALTRGGFLNNPLAMTTSGDLPYLDSNGNQARLACPSNGDYAITWTTGVPTYTSAPSFAGVTVTGLNTATVLVAYSDASGPGFLAQRFRNTSAAPRRAKSGDSLAVFNVQGGFAVDDTTAATLSGTSARLGFTALEDWTSTARGSKMIVLTTAIGSTTATQRLEVTDTALTLAGGVNLSSPSAKIGGAGAIEASALLQVKGSGASTAVSTTDTYALLVSANSPHASFLHTTFSTDVADGFTFEQISTGLASISTGNGPAATTNRGQHLDFDYANRFFDIYPGSATGSARIGVAININGTANQYNQTFIQILSKRDAGNAYFDSSIWLGTTDNTNPAALTYAIGSEGHWTFAGGFTTYRFYLWDYVNSRTVYYIDNTAPAMFKFDTGIDVYTMNNVYFGGSTAIGTSSVGVLSWKNGTAPGSNVTDCFQMYAADQAAGNSAPHFRTENGGIVKLYQVNTYTITNAGADRAFDANATTIDELADVLGTLIADIKLTGLLA